MPLYVADVALRLLNAYQRHRGQFSQACDLEAELDAILGIDIAMDLGDASGHPVDIMRAVAYHGYLVVLHTAGPAAAQCYAEEAGLLEPGQVGAPRRPT